MAYFQKVEFPPSAQLPFVWLAFSLLSLNTIVTSVEDLYETDFKTLARRASTEAWGVQATLDALRSLRDALLLHRGGVHAPFLNAAPLMLVHGVLDGAIMNGLRSADPEVAELASDALAELLQQRRCADDTLQRGEVLDAAVSALETWYDKDCDDCAGPAHCVAPQIRALTALARADARAAQPRLGEHAVTLVRLATTVAMRVRARRQELEGEVVERGFMFQRQFSMGTLWGSDESLRSVIGAAGSAIQDIQWCDAVSENVTLLLAALLRKYPQYAPDMVPAFAELSRGATLRDRLGGGTEGDLPTRLGNGAGIEILLDSPTIVLGLALHAALPPGDSLARVPRPAHVSAADWGFMSALRPRLKEVQETWYLRASVAVDWSSDEWWTAGLSVGTAAAVGLLWGAARTAWALRNVHSPAEIARPVVASTGPLPSSIHFATPGYVPPVSGPAPHVPSAQQAMPLLPPLQQPHQQQMPRGWKARIVMKHGLLAAGGAGLLLALQELELAVDARAWLVTVESQAAAALCATLAEMVALLAVLRNAPFSFLPTLLARRRGRNRADRLDELAAEWSRGDEV